MVLVDQMAIVCCWGPVFLCRAERVRAVWRFRFPSKTGQFRRRKETGRHAKGGAGIILDLGGIKNCVEVRPNWLHEGYVQ